MIEFAVAYLLGTALGEVALLAVWFRGQDAGMGLLDYWRAKRGDILLAATLGAMTTLIWAEGTMLKMIVDWKSLDLSQTLGVSVVAGGTVSIFSRQVMRAALKAVEVGVKLAGR